jgi:hypothetical protein
MCNTYIKSTYGAYSFQYITLGLETVFLAFSTFGLNVPGGGAEVQSMLDVLHNWKYEGSVKIDIELSLATIQS